MSTAAAIPYRPPVCPQCGYSLEGHTHSGVCSECGTPFGGSHLYLFAWSNWNRPSAARRFWIHPTSIILMICLLAPMIGLLVISTLLYRHWSSVHLGRVTILTSTGLVLFMFLLYVWTFLGLIRERRRALAKMPAPLQFRAAPDAFTWKFGLGKPRIWLKWKRIRRLTYKIKSPHRVTLRLTGFWGLIWCDLDLDLSPEAAAPIAEQLRAWLLAANPRAKIIFPP